MPDEGWIKFHRQLLDNPVVMKDGDHLAIWSFVLLNVCYVPTDVDFDGRRITLNPGQFTTGRKEIASKLHINEQKVQRVLKRFEDDHQIAQQMSNKCRLVTVLNWETYQSVNNQVNNKRTTTEQQVNTNKEYKNIRINPLTPLTGSDLGLTRWAPEDIKKQYDAGLKPYLEGYPAFYDRDKGAWRTKTHSGEWMEYNDSIIRNLTWK